MLSRIPALCAIAAGSLLPTLSAQQTCTSLTALTLPHTTITSSLETPEGPIGAGGGGNAPPVAPARCAVQGIIRPTKDSEVRFELWLPSSNWNGKYLQVGHAGWAGTVPTPVFLDAIHRGYAVAGTDDGHQGGGAAWAIGHPEKVTDFAYRAVHETGVQAKAIVRAFFGRDPAHSYFNGCSEGGREALKEAQVFAEDFDGIIAGAPAGDLSHLMTGFIWNAQALAETASSAIPASKLPAIQKAVLAACDALDGVKDGLLEDPRTCHFDPGVLMCKGPDVPDCLLAPQVEALRKIYDGPTSPRGGAQIFPGYAKGTEAGWSPRIVRDAPAISAGLNYALAYFGQLVLERATWNFTEMNFDSDVAFTEAKAGALDATNPDLRSFRANGGKLIQFHGWGDAQISPFSSIAYYSSVDEFLRRFPDLRDQGASTIDNFYRLFMVPGMGHCGGGPGPTEFGLGIGAVSTRVDPEHDVLSALEQWVEGGVAPQKIIGTGTAPLDPSKTLTRPLCPFPQVARYKGGGEINEAASFVCAIPGPPAVR